MKIKLNLADKIGILTFIIIITVSSLIAHRIIKASYNNSYGLYESSAQIISDFVVDNFPLGKSEDEISEYLTLTLERNYKITQIQYDRGGISLKARDAAFRPDDITLKTRIDEEVITLSFSTADLKAGYNTMKNKAVQTAIILMFAGVLIASLFTIYLVKPLLRLTEIIRKIQAGDLDHNIEVSRKDEIGVLASAFNELTTSLKEKEDTMLVAYDEISKRQELFERAVEICPENIILSDAEKKVITISRKVEELFGVNTNDVVGGPVEEVFGFVPADYKQSFLNFLNDFLKSADEEKVFNINDDKITFSKIKEGDTVKAVLTVLVKG